MDVAVQLTVLGGRAGERRNRDYGWSGGKPVLLPWDGRDGAGEGTLTTGRAQSTWVTWAWRGVRREMRRGLAAGR